MDQSAGLVESRPQQEPVTHIVPKGSTGDIVNGAGCSMRLVSDDLDMRGALTNQDRIRTTQARSLLHSVRLCRRAATGSR